MTRRRIREKKWRCTFYLFRPIRRIRRIFRVNFPREFWNTGGKKKNLIVTRKRFNISLKLIKVITILVPVDRASIGAQSIARCYVQLMTLSNADDGGFSRSNTFSIITRRFRRKMDRCNRRTPMISKRWNRFRIIGKTLSQFTRASQIPFFIVCDRWWCGS